MSEYVNRALCTCRNNGDLCEFCDNLTHVLEACEKLLCHEWPKSVFELEFELNQSLIEFYEAHPQYHGRRGIDIVHIPRSEWPAHIREFFDKQREGANGD